MNRKVLVVQMVLGMFLCFPVTGLPDQTDQRLDELFLTLQNSNSESVLLETESTIWEIWFDSGEDDINKLMDQAAEAAQIGQLAKAESLYTQVIEQRPDFSEGWNRRATVRFYRKKYEDSLADIEQTLRLEPRHFGAIWGLGMILGSKQEFSRAILAFERLLEIKPNARDARHRIELLKQEMAKQAV
jgi:tetratricopeptide (TPR) repeat protein